MEFISGLVIGGFVGIVLTAIYIIVLDTLDWWF